MPLSNAGATAANSLNSPIVFLCLLTFSLPGEPTLRLVNNTEEIISRGNKFEPYPFSVVLPNDDPEGLPSVQLRIDNVAGVITEYIRSLPQPPTLLLEVISTINPDVVEKSVGFLKLQQVSFNSIEVSGTLGVDNILSRRFPFESYDPVSFPALFV
jgi:hypothetical protein